MPNRPRLNVGDIVVVYDYIDMIWLQAYVQAYTPGSAFVNVLELWAAESSVGRVHDIEAVRHAVWSFAGPVMVP